MVAFVFVLTPQRRSFVKYTLPTPIAAPLVSNRVVVNGSAPLPVDTVSCVISQPELERLQYHNVRNYFLKFEHLHRGPSVIVVAKVMRFKRIG